MIDQTALAALVALSDVQALAPEHGFASVLELASYKREHSEKSELSAWLVAGRVRGLD